MWNQTIFDKYNLLNSFKKKIKISSSYYFKKLSRDRQLRIHNYITSDDKKFYSNQNLFDAIFFELRTKCNSQCTFCAASIQNDIRPDITMSFELYEKVINELAEINYDKRISFHVNSEPLLVKNLHEYISLARKKCPNSWIQILSNGRSLNNQRGEEILNAGIDELSLNLYRKTLTEKLPMNIKKFEEEVLYKIYNKENVYHGLPGKINKKRFPKYIKYTKTKRLVEEVLSNRAGSAPNKKNNHELPNLGYCSHPFSQFNITVNGDVGQCCADFFFQSKMGNVKNNSILEIWNGNRFKNLRDSLKKSQRHNNLLCAGCDHFGMNNLPKNFIKRQIYKLLFINDD